MRIPIAFVLRFSDQTKTKSIDHFAYAIIYIKHGFKAQLVVDLIKRYCDIAHITTKGQIFILDEGFRQALADLQPARAFLVYSGDERYPKGDGIEAIGVREITMELAALGG